MVRQAIQQSRDGCGIGKDGVPVLEGFVGGDQNRSTFVAAIDDLIKKVGRGSVIGKVTDFVNGEQMRLGVVIEFASQHLRRIAMKIGQDFRRRAEQHGEAGLKSGVGDIFSDHGFAEAIGAHQDEVAAFRNKVEREGSFDGGAIDFLGPVPVEVGDRLEAVDAGTLNAPFQRSARTFLDFRAREFFQQQLRRPAGFGGAGDKVIQILCRRGQAELKKMGVEIRCRFQ